MPNDTVSTREIEKALEPLTFQTYAAGRGDLGSGKAAENVRQLVDRAVTAATTALRKRVGFALLYGHLGDTAEDIGLQLMYGVKKSDEEDIIARIIAEYPNEWASEDARADVS